MDKPNEKKAKKRGILAILKESMTKSSEGCGPGCGCHAEEKKKEELVNDNVAAKGNKKR